MHDAKTTKDRAWPWVTLLFVVTAMLASLRPEAFEYSRSAVLERGEWWRSLSGQWVHWSARMAWLDLGVVALLGWWSERASPKATRALCGVTVVLVALLVHGWTDVERFRGASGLSVALFAWVALQLAFERRDRSRLIGIAAFLGLLGKVLFEALTGRTLFAGPLPEGVVVLPVAHLAGLLAAVGVMLGLKYVVSE